MKKKGLIISTVVMVVVLIASLTTATYAWFTASSKTEIAGFDVSVVSNNAVNIGMKSAYGLADTVSETQFVTGDVSFTSGTTTESGPGIMENPGSWAGTTGLSSTLTHNINWGSQAQAVGVSTQAVTSDDFSKVNESNTRFWVTDTVSEGNITYGTNTNGKNTVIAANKGTTDGQLTGAKKANANINGSGAGDYVHFILGVSPTRALDKNSFVIMIVPTDTTSQLGVLASIHVAYRVVKQGASATNAAWTEVDVYGTNTWSTKTDNVTSNVTGSVLTAYQNTIGNTSATAPKGSYAVSINGLDTEVNKISQVEVVIYMAGADSDCNDQGKTSAGNIMMFFDTTNATTKATVATLGTDNKLTITGGEASYTAANTTVKIGETVIAGTWTNGTFTSTGTVTATAGTTKVTIQNSGKEAKELTIVSGT